MNSSVPASEETLPADPELVEKGGLTQEEAENRLRQYGYNELPEKKRNPLLELLIHFWGPIPWMIEAAAVLSALDRQWDDFIIIAVLLLANAGVGFWEEFQAGNAIAALKATLAPQARVRRDDTWKLLPARELVPGDDPVAHGRCHPSRCEHQPR